MAIAAGYVVAWGGVEGLSATGAHDAA